MFGGDKGKTRRVHNLQADVAALEAALEAAKAEYDRVLDRNLKVISYTLERAKLCCPAAHSLTVKLLQDLAGLATPGWWCEVSECCCGNCELCIVPALGIIPELAVLKAILQQPLALRWCAGDKVFPHAFSHHCCAAQEVQRWEKDRAEDFGVMLNQFAGMEVAFHERSRDVWQEVAEQMPAVPSTSHQ